MTVQAPGAGPSGNVLRESTPAEVDAAVAKAAGVAARWASSDASTRERLLDTLADALEAERDG